MNDDFYLIGKDLLDKLSPDQLSMLRTLAVSHRRICEQDIGILRAKAQLHGMPDKTLGPDDLDQLGRFMEQKRDVTMLQIIIDEKLSFETKAYKKY